MKKLIHGLFAVAVLSAALQPVIARADFAKGEVLNHVLSVCVDKADALAIVNTHATKGREAAESLWNAKDKCATIPVIGPTVGKTVLSIAVDTDGVKKIARVIEVLDGEGKVIGYFMTTAPLKAERNT